LTLVRKSSPKTSVAKPPTFLNCCFQGRGTLTGWTAQESGQISYPKLSLPNTWLSIEEMLESFYDVPKALVKDIGYRMVPFSTSCFPPSK